MNEREGERQRFFIVWFTLQIATMTRADSIRSQEPGYRSFFWVSLKGAGTHVIRPFYVALPVMRVVS